MLAELRPQISEQLLHTEGGGDRQHQDNSCNKSPTMLQDAAGKPTDCQDRSTRMSTKRHHDGHTHTHRSEDSCTLTVVGCEFDTLNTACRSFHTVSLQLSPGPGPGSTSTTSLPPAGGGTDAGPVTTNGTAQTRPGPGTAESGSNQNQSSAAVTLTSHNHEMLRLPKREGPKCTWGW